MDHQQHTPTTTDAPCAETSPRQGLVTVFTGDGRGKTTAAIGTALRATGCGLRVLIVFFMKGPDFTHGEIVALKDMALVTVRSYGAPGWAIPGHNNTNHELQATQALAYATDEIASGKYDVAVLDEVLNAASLGLLSWEALTHILSTKPAGLELILTGRDVPAELIERADQVTEMRNIKHPYERGILARPGIDY